MLNTQRGFSLLEVLVALVVLSIGLMGIASMQVVGLQFNQQALTSTRAIELAADMADRIRANVGSEQAAILRNTYEVDFDAPAANPGTWCADRMGGTVAIGDCTKAQLAEFDIWQWKRALQAGSGSGLADGAGSIDHEIDLNGLSTYTIDVRWSERGEEAHYVLEVLL